MVSEVGARIRSLRTARGLTQAQVAEPQYTKAYISMLESGRTRASMKALEHIAAVLGVQPSDLLGGSASPAIPQYDLLEARRLIEQGRATEAIAILDRLDEGLPPADQLVRLRSLAAAHNALGEAKHAFPLIERAQRVAELLGDGAELVRVKAELAAAYAATFAHADAIRSYREVVQACDDGVLVYTVDATKANGQAPVTVKAAQPSPDPARIALCGLKYAAPFDVGPGEVSTFEDANVKVDVLGTDGTNYRVRVTRR